MPDFNIIWYRKNEIVQAKLCSIIKCKTLIVTSKSTTNSIYITINSWNLTTMFTYHYQQRIRTSYFLTKLHHNFTSQYSFTTQFLNARLYNSSAVAEICDRGHNRHMGRKGGAALPLSLGGAGSQSNTMWPGPRSTYVPSGVFIHPALWPQ